MHPVPPFLVSRNISPLRAAAQNPLRSMKRISDHSRARFTANPELAFQARIWDLRACRFTKNAYQKFFNVRSRDYGTMPTQVNLYFEIGLALLAFPVSA
jgi:hypothetical protein